MLPSHTKRSFIWAFRSESEFQAADRAAQVEVEVGVGLVGLAPLVVLGPAVAREDSEMLHREEACAGLVFLRSDAAVIAAATD